MTAGELAGRHALVTGGGRGIGAAIARELARLGASLTLVGRAVPPLEACAAWLRKEHGTPAFVHPCDVSDEAEVRRAFAAAREAQGPIGVLVNNAGQAEGAPFAETSLELWDRMLAVNLTGTFLCAREALPDMLRAEEGRIVNIASTTALKAYRGVAAYTAAKHGVLGLTRALALETARSGVTVNAVCPGYTDTDMAQRAVDEVMAATGKSPEEARRAIERTNPLGRLIRPEEVAASVSWLCSPEAAAVTGQAVVVAGGEVM